MIQALRPGDPGEVGGYRVVARLGAGGMGEVFLGRSASGRLVAIKVVRAELSIDPDFRTRFRREVDASRRVSAFHTAAVVAADADATPAWMVTEYIPGPSLEEAVRGHGAFPVHALRVLGAGLAEALEAIHACGLIHRDLKPSNILIAEDGPRVIDFGIARALEGATVTQTGYMVGSVGFLSPEQLLADRITPAADVFALGAVLCSAAGLAPFGGGSAQAMLYRVVHTEPDLTGLPDDLLGIVASCLAKEPTERPRPTDLVRMLTSSTTEDWLPEGVLASIRERREHAQHLSRQLATGGAAPETPPEPAAPSFSVSAGPSAHSGASKSPDTTAGTGHDSGPGTGSRADSGFGSAVGPTYDSGAVPSPPPASGPVSSGAGSPVPPPPSHSPPYGSTPPGSTPPGSTPWQSPYAAPPLPFPHQPAAPPRTTRLDRLPGGRRAWIVAIVVTAMAVLAGIGVGTSMLLDDGPNAAKTTNPSGPTTAGQNPQGGGRKGGTATVSINADSQSLDPVATTYEAYADGQRMSALYDPLVIFRQSTGKVEPHLAKSLTASPDGFTWSLELRPDVKFTDGTPLDAEAVKFNWDRHADPNTRSLHANAIRGATMRVVSPTRLDITLPVPDLTYDHLIADELAYIGSPTAIRADPEAFGKKPVGAGPFMLESWAPGDKQVFVRNPDYWQGPERPLLDSLVFKVETQQPVAPVIAGSADVNFQSAHHDLQQARSAGLELVPAVNTGGVMMGFNSSAAPFDNQKARQAVTFALDPAAIAEAAGNGVKATDNIVPSQSPLSSVAPDQRHDPAKAQALFDELAAAGKPLSFTVLAGEGERQTMEAVKQQFARYKNVTMSYELADASRFGDLLGRRQFQAVLGYESGADLDTWLFAITRGGYSGNYLGYRATAVDNAWTAVRGARTPESKAAAYETLLTALSDDPPWWVYAEIAVFAVQREGTLTGLDGVYADGLMRWDRVAKK